MFASLKRSPVDSGRGTRTEQRSGTDYADLEKRPDGRWSVHIHDAVQRDGKTPRHETCCWFLPVRLSVLLFTMLALMISVTFAGAMGMAIVRSSASFVYGVGIGLMRVFYSYCRRIDTTHRLTRLSYLSIAFG